MDTGWQQGTMAQRMAGRPVPQKGHEDGGASLPLCGRVCWMVSTCYKLKVFRVDIGANKWRYSLICGVCVGPIQLRLCKKGGCLRSLQTPLAEHGLLGRLHDLICPMTAAIGVHELTCLRKHWGQGAAIVQGKPCAQQMALVFQRFMVFIRGT